MAAKTVELNLSKESQGKFDKIVQEELGNITEKTIELGNLGNELLESDLDKYLALKDETPSKMSLRNKYKLVAELLAEQVNKTGRKAAVDTHFLGMAIEARVNAERAEKEKEMHTAVRQSASPYRSKDTLKEMRTEIKDLEGYSDKFVKDELKQSRKEIKERKAQKSKKNLELKADKFVKDVLPKIEDSNYYADILVSLSPLLESATQVINMANLAKKAEQVRLVEEHEARKKEQEEVEKDSVRVTETA